MIKSTKPLEEALANLSFYSKKYLEEHEFEHELVKNMVNNNIKRDTKMLKEVLKLTKDHYKTIKKYDDIYCKNIELNDYIELLENKLKWMKKHPGLVYTWTPDDMRDMGYYCPWCDGFLKRFWGDEDEPNPDTCPYCNNKLDWSSWPRGMDKQVVEKIFEHNEEN